MNQLETPPLAWDEREQNARINDVLDDSMIVEARDREAAYTVVICATVKRN